METSKTIEGGPETISAPPPTGVPPVVEPPKENVALYKGFNGEIKDQSGLIEYVKTIETELVRERLAKTAPPAATVTQPVAVQADAAFKQQLEDVWYSNPSKAVEIIEERVKGTIAATDNQKANQKKFWEDFYTEANDLNSPERKRVVDLIVKDRWDHFTKLSVSDAKKEIMKEARDVVGALRKGANASEIEVTSKTAHLTGASGEPIKGSEASPKAPMTTIQQLQQFRNKRRKAV